MPTALTKPKIDQFPRDGFSSPLAVFDAAQASIYRARLKNDEHAQLGCYQLQAPEAAVR